MKLAAVGSAAVAAAAAAEAAGPDEGEESKATQKLLPTNLKSRSHQHLLGMKKLGRLFILAVECISCAPASSRAAGDIRSIPSKLTSVSPDTSWPRGTTRTLGPLSTASAMAMESKVLQQVT